MGLCCSKNEKTPKNKNKTKNKDVPEASDGLLNDTNKKEKAQESEGIDPKNVNFELFERRGVFQTGDKLDVVGMTVLRPNIYILSRNPSTISIHKNEEPFEKLGEVILEEIHSPWDISSSQKSKCVYITDYNKNTIFKMALPGHELTPWLTGISHPHTLSITDPDNYLLVVKHGEPSSLEVIDDEAKVVLRIDLPEKIEYPKHAVQTSSGNFFVSGKAKGDETFKVFEVNQEGVIQRETTEVLTECYHLAAGLENRLLVADCWMNRILVFDSDLQRDQVVNLEFKWPRRIQFVPQENLLYVLTGPKPKKTISKTEETDEEEEKAVKDEVEEDKSFGAISIYAFRETAMS